MKLQIYSTQGRRQKEVVWAKTFPENALTKQNQKTKF